MSHATPYALETPAVKKKRSAAKNAAENDEDDADKNSGKKNTCYY